METVIVRELAPDDLDEVKRLHKYAKFNGRPVFSQYGADAASVLEAAAEKQSGAFGLVAVAISPEDPEEPELVGAITAQLTAATSTTPSSGSTTNGNNTQPDPAGTVQQQPGNSHGEVSELVLLTLVVRADVRKQGVGRQLVQALIKQGSHRPSGQPLQQVVTDIAVNNVPAWQFFQQLGFQRSTAPGNEVTAEAVLNLDPWATDQSDPASHHATAAKALRSNMRGRSSGMFSCGGTQQGHVHALNRTSRSNMQRRWYCAAACLTQGGDDYKMRHSRVVPCAHAVHRANSALQQLVGLGCSRRVTQTTSSNKSSRAGQRIVLMESAHNRHSCSRVVLK